MLKKADNEIVCIAQFTAIDGKEDELVRSLHGLMEPTHREEGYIRYELNQQIDDPRVVTFVEKFASREAFDLHCAMPYIKSFFDTVAPDLVEAKTVTLHREILP